MSCLSPVITGCLKRFVAVLAFIVYHFDYERLQSYWQRRCQSTVTLNVWRFAFMFFTAPVYFGLVLFSASSKAWITCRRAFLRRSMPVCFLWFFELYSLAHYVKTLDAIQSNTLRLTTHIYGKINTMWSEFNPPFHQQHTDDLYKPCCFCVSIFILICSDSVFCKNIDSLQ